MEWTTVLVSAVTALAGIGTGLTAARLQAKNTERQLQTQVDLLLREQGEANRNSSERHTTSSSMSTERFSRLRSRVSSSTGASTPSGRSGSTTPITHSSSSVRSRCAGRHRISPISSPGSSGFRKGKAAAKKSGRRITAEGSRSATSGSSPTSSSAGPASSQRCAETLRLRQRNVRHDRQPLRQRKRRIGWGSLAFGATPVWPCSKSKNATPDHLLTRR
jgi:hypothetical protein